MQRLSFDCFAGSKIILESGFFWHSDPTFCSKEMKLPIISLVLPHVLLQRSPLIWLVHVDEGKSILHGLEPPLLWHLGRNEHR
jgi:hypothetical protein